MAEYLIRILGVLLPLVPVHAQGVKFQIVAPAQLKGRSAVFLTREKGFATLVHSVKLGADTLVLSMNPALLPDLYQLHVSKIKGSLFFFLEPGCRIQLDTTDLSRSVVSNSRSNPEWQLFFNTFQQPHEERLKAYVTGENQARKREQSDSLSYWTEKQTTERQNYMEQISRFIRANPRSFVSLYLLKIHWFALKDQQLFEALDTHLASHPTYTYLKEKNRK